MAMITVGSSTITPQQVMLISSEREVRSIVHPILGRSNPDVTVRQSNLRTGVVEMGFYGVTSEQASATAETLLAGGGVFSIVAPERPTLAMTAVPQGTVTRELDDETRDAWIVRVPYQEVTT